MTDTDNTQPEVQLTPEEMQAAQEAMEAAASQAHTQNRSEKKTRKALGKMGLSPVEDVTRVTLRRGRQVIAIDRPDVYKFPSSDTFMIFGEARIEDPAAAAQQAAARQFSAPSAAGAAGAAAASSSGAVVEEEVGEVDETGLDQEDIKLVMQQANVARGRAAKALKQFNGDIVEAVMSLTS
jgi:nascent polypeptide-associated complex subunit alpha